DLTPEQVAKDALAGIEQETFVILPHPQVLGYMRKKTENYDRWISGMAKIQAKMREAYGKGRSSILGRRCALIRHCERSEAIHSAAQRIDGLLRRFAPRNDMEGPNPQP